MAGYNRIQQEEAYKFYQQWISPKFPRCSIIEIQHANPFYDDSYAVNSANLGPYGDAIENELMPAHREAVSRHRPEAGRGFIYGGSTGGWESLAVQMFYPDHYNGVFAPVPTRSISAPTRDQYLQRQECVYHRRRAQARRAARHAQLSRQRVSQQQDNNATSWHWVDTDGRASSGTSGRRFMARWAQTAIRQPIFDKETGEIDHEVAEYWRSITT